MRIVNDKSLFWICTRRVNGRKYNRGKKCIRDGTIFDGAMLSLQTILTIRIYRKCPNILKQLNFIFNATSSGEMCLSGAMWHQMVSFVAYCG